MFTRLHSSKLESKLGYSKTNKTDWGQGRTGVAVGGVAAAKE